jgi:hypothetical protein
MSNITIQIEAYPTTEEQKAITALEFAGDQANLTRSQAAYILRTTGNVDHVHIGGGHIALCRGWNRVALVTSTHPDWT